LCDECLKYGVLFNRYALCLSFEAIYLKKPANAILTSEICWSLSYIVDKQCSKPIHNITPRNPDIDLMPKQHTTLNARKTTNKHQTSFGR